MALWLHFIGIRAVVFCILSEFDIFTTVPDFDNDSPNSLTRVRDPLNQRFEGLLLRRVV